MIISSARSFDGKQSKSSGTVRTKYVFGQLVVNLPGLNNLSVGPEVVYRLLKLNKTFKS